MQDFLTGAGTEEDFVASGVAGRFEAEFQIAFGIGLEDLRAGRAIDSAAVDGVDHDLA